ncbi:MAG: DUF1820 family protein [Acidiferrobacterales bacterium]
MAKKHIYRVIFFNQGTIYEVYARNVHHGNLYGFVEVEGLIFGEKSSVVIDPSEERLKTEFTGVQRTYVPMHAVMRIDEVEKKGTAKITPIPGKGDNITSFPVPIYTPTDGSSKT